MSKRKKKKQRILKAIPDDTILEDEIRAEIEKIFREEIFKPLAKLLSIKEKEVIVKNAESKTPNLEKAIKSGKVSFDRGRLSGEFNSKISRELRSLGAVFDSKTKSYKILKSKLPKDIVTAVSVSRDRLTKTLGKLNRAILGLSSAKIAEKLDIDSLIDKNIFNLDKKIGETLKDISVQPKLTKTERAGYVKDYKENMKKNIVSFSDNEVKNLRKLVETSYKSGTRRPELAKKIQERYGVSKTKAKFLARQETSLLAAKFKEVRYKEAGVTEYIWKTVAGSPGHPVRKDHKDLNNKTFKWSEPPISNKRTGARNHPGEDFGCRCVARPVMRGL